LDRRLFALVRDEGIAPVWFVLNKVADEEVLGDRLAAREMRLLLWGRLKRLFWLRLVFRAGRGLVSIAPPALPKGAGESWKRRATVRQTPGAKPVSTGTSQDRAYDEDQGQPVETQCTPPENPGIGGDATDNQTKSAKGRSDVADGVARQIEELIHAERVSAVAKALAALPRRPRRRWTGWLSDTCHAYRGQSVIITDGSVGTLYGVLRGKAIFVPGTESSGHWGEKLFGFAVVPTSEVRPFLNPAAQLLGRQKAGTIERKSEAKARAARLNGLKPTRPGRKRGRRPVNTIPGV
jgi:hypothetical protein